MTPTMQHHAAGSRWPAGRTVWGLCAAYNHATRPHVPLTAHQHHRANQYARAIRNRMSRLGLRWYECDDGRLWPLARAIEE